MAKDSSHSDNPIVDAEFPSLEEAAGMRPESVRRRRSPNYGFWTKERSPNNASTSGNPVNRESTTLLGSSAESPPNSKNSGIIPSPGTHHPSPNVIADHLISESDRAEFPSLFEAMRPKSTKETEPKEQSPPTKKGKEVISAPLPPQPPMDPPNSSVRRQSRQHPSTLLDRYLQIQNMLFGEDEIPGELEGLRSKFAVSDDEDDDEGNSRTLVRGESSLNEGNSRTKSSLNEGNSRTLVRGESSLNEGNSRTSVRRSSQQLAGVNGHPAAYSSIASPQPPPTLFYGSRPAGQNYLPNHIFRPTWIPNTFTYPIPIAPQSFYYPIITPLSFYPLLSFYPFALAYPPIAPPLFYPPTVLPVPIYRWMWPNPNATPFYPPSPRPAPGRPDGQT